MATVRLAEQRDADAVLALLAGLGRSVEPEHVDAVHAVFLDHLAYDDARVFVAVEGGALVGVASFWLRPRLNQVALEGWVPDLYVEAEHRRQGIGRALLDACAAEARRRGCDCVVVQSGEPRVEAHALFESCGFAEVGRHYFLHL